MKLLHQLLGSSFLMIAKETDVIADMKTRWVKIKLENVDTKNKKTTTGSAYNGGEYWGSV